MEGAEYLCVCADLTSGVVLISAYTTILSLVFLGVSIDLLMHPSTRAASANDEPALYFTYGAVLILTVILIMASSGLVMGASHKLKTYLLPWLVCLPIWTISVVCMLLILPARISEANELTDLNPRIGGSVFLILFNIYCFACVLSLFIKIARVPDIRLLKQQTVGDVLQEGFSGGYSRLRESFRHVKGDKKRKTKTHSLENAHVEGHTNPGYDNPEMTNIQNVETIQGIILAPSNLNATGQRNSDVVSFENPGYSPSRRLDITATI